MSLEMKNGYGHTALYLAAESCRVDIVARLLCAGADAKMVCKKCGYTPLAVAVSQGCTTDIVQTLLWYRAEVRSESGDRRSVIEHAHRYRRILQIENNPDLAAERK